MIGFAFIFAPSAFSHIGATPAFAATIAASIRGVTVFGYGCTTAVVLACIPGLRRVPRNWWLIAIALVMSALGWYEVQMVVPLMERTALQTPAYDALHHQSSSVYGVILILGLAGLGLSATEKRSLLPHQRDVI